LWTLPATACRLWMQRYELVRMMDVQMPVMDDPAAAVPA
jgi:hypothetical protein